ncbi:hypothetical protein [Pantoea dispersa]|uniref:hypothetical protein n=1 Tax=Pantoea dispersa TaxID=59814 RepID=UPI0039B62EA9
MMQTNKYAIDEKCPPFAEFNGVTFYIDDFMKMYEEGARITQKLLSGEMLTTWMQGDEMICEVTHQDA